MEFLSTGCESLDRLLGGGIRRGEIALVYGKPGTGKTSLTMQCAFLCAKKGFKIIFVDSDWTFSPDRLAQIAGNELQEISPLILVFKPRNFREQTHLIEELDNYNLRNITLIVIDTITALYRAELDTTEKIFALNMKLNWQLAYLKELAQSYNIGVFLTSQVHTIIQKNQSDERVEPVASRVLKFWAQKIINLEATENPRVKEARLETDSDRISDKVSCFYTLNSKGVVSFR